MTPETTSQAPRAKPVDRVLVALLSAAFVALGWPFIRSFGIEVDEAIMANGLYAHGAPLYSWNFGEFELPLMLLSYLGALKTWIWGAIFEVWAPGPISLRLPAILTGAATVWLFFELLNSLLGRRAAWIGATLLATDTSFLLNETIDYGPVALHHLLKLGALIALWRFDRGGRLRDLAVGAFLLGLAMWDKAIFSWSLAGLAVAVAVVFPRELFAHIKVRAVACAAFAFALGALPLIAYNIARPLDTFRSNAHLSLKDAEVKRWLLRCTVNGSVMFGFLTADNAGPKPGLPRRAAERLASTISRWGHAPRVNWMEWAAIASLATLPFIWRYAAQRNAILFAWIYLTVTWVQMFLTTGAGAAAHHILLLWPFHMLAIAAAMDAIALRFRRPGAISVAALTALLSLTNLLVTNEYFVDLIRNGTSVRWSDAFPELVSVLGKSGAKSVYAADWGILETVNLLTKGTAPLVALDETAVVPGLFAQPLSIFVSHAPRYLELPGISSKINRAAAALGLEKEVITTVYDRNGRGIFEIYRFRRAGS